MKIGLLALSGVRACDPELISLGLTLPAFVQRSKTVASLPSLGLLYLAAVTPPHHHLRYFEAERDGAESPDLYACDLVAISTFSAQALEAYAIADRLRAANVLVAIGGLHASALPLEAAQHAHFVLTGEAENTWPHLLLAAEQRLVASRGAPCGRPLPSPQHASSRHNANVGATLVSPENPAAASDAQPSIRSPKGLPLRGDKTAPPPQHAPLIFHASNYRPVDVSTLPTPRYDLLAGRSYNRYTVQTSRGCPWRCEFCASTVMLSERYRRRPIDQILRDVRAIQQLHPRPFIEFADDNTFVDHAWGLELCSALAPLRLRWFTETDITVAHNDQLLGALRRSGCRQLLVGLESPSRPAVEGLELRRNAKARWADDYAPAIAAIQSHGLTVNGCFILGLDTHTPDIFDEVFDFVMATHLYEVQITLLTPFPGTPLYSRLKNENRLLHDGQWNRCTLFDVAYLPAQMSPDQLAQGFRDLMQRLYSPENVAARRRPFLTRHRRPRTHPPSP